MSGFDSPDDTLIQALPLALPASLRAAAVPLPFTATAAPPRQGDTVDLAAVLAAQVNAVDLSRVQMALRQVCAPLHATGGGMVDRRIALATLRETHLTAADLPPPSWAK